MSAKGKIVESWETGIPDAVILKLSERRNLELRVALRKPKYRQIHRILGTSSIDEARTKVGLVYSQLMQQPDEDARKVAVDIARLMDLFFEEQQNRMNRKEISAGQLKGIEVSIYKALLPYCIKRRLTMVDQVSFKTFSEYGSERVSMGYEQSTVNTEIRHVKQFLLWSQKVKGHWGGFEWYRPTI